MARKPAEDPRVHQLRVRLSEAEAKMLDQARGNTTRSDFIRHLIQRRSRG